MGGHIVYKHLLYDANSRLALTGHVTHFHTFSNKTCSHKIISRNQKSIQS
jgi:hypothetical protein